MVVFSGILFILNLILAAIQGVAEIFPMSSSAHILIFEKLFGQSITFAQIVLFHFGTLVAITLFYYRDAVKLAQGKLGPRLRRYFLISFLVTGLIGFILVQTVDETLVSRPDIVAELLVANGAALAFVAWKRKVGQLHISDLGVGAFLFIGVVQGLTALPGISRLGWTLCAGLILGLNWSEALKCSFLLSIPTIFFANLFTMASNAGWFGSLVVNQPSLGGSPAFSLDTPGSLVNLILNCLPILVISFLCALWALRQISHFLGRRLLMFFGLYCAVAGTYFWIVLGLP